MDEQENKVNIPEQENKENIPEQKKKTPPMRIWAYVLFGLQILGFAGSAVQSGANVLRAIAYAIGFCVPMIVGVILLENSYTNTSAVKTVNKKSDTATKKSFTFKMPSYLMLLNIANAIILVLSVISFATSREFIWWLFFSAALFGIYTITFIYNEKWLYILCIILDIFTIVLSISVLIAN